MCPKSYLYIYDFSAYLHLCPSDRFGTDRGRFCSEPVLCILHPVPSGGTCFPTFGIRGIKEESMETPTSLGKAISEFFNMHYGMSDVNVYGAHRVGKHGVTRSRRRPIVYIMMNDTKRRIILENS